MKKSKQNTIEKKCWNKINSSEHKNAFLPSVHHQAPYFLKGKNNVKIYTFFLNCKTVIDKSIQETISSSIWFYFNRKRNNFKNYENFKAADSLFVKWKDCSYPPMTLVLRQILFKWIHNIKCSIFSFDGHNYN